MDKDVRLDIRNVLPVIKGKIVCIEDGENKPFSSAEDALGYYKGDYINATSIYAKDDVIYIEVEDIEEKVKADIIANQERFIREHKEKYGREPNPFDGA